MAAPTALLRYNISDITVPDDRFSFRFACMVWMIHAFYLMPFLPCTLFHGDKRAYVPFCSISYAARSTTTV